MGVGLRLLEIRLALFIKRVKYWTPSFKEGEERPLGRDITHVLRPPDLTTTPKAGLLSFLIP